MKKEIYKKINLNIDNYFLIIVPTLNSYKQLKNLVDLINKQNYTKWRVVFIDGKSSDIHKNYLRNICNQFNKFSFLEEDNFCNSIYGAMNLGFPLISSNEWILFWGSDDYPINEKILSSINNVIKSYLKKFETPDLFIFSGSYVTEEYKFLKNSYFLSNKKNHIIKDKSFRKKLFLGFVPPHQATLINSKIVSKNIFYDESYSLASDLDFFLRLSKMEKIFVITSSLPIVNMTIGGVSSKKHFLRTKEVIRIYINSFGILFFFPFLFRYLRRIIRSIL